MIYRVLLLLLGVCAGLGISSADVVAQTGEADSVTVDRPRFPTTPT